MARRICTASCSKCVGTQYDDNDVLWVLCEGGYSRPEGTQCLYGKMSTSHQQNDPVNHPPHYNKGGVECIDCIESAVSGLTGPEAVLTGNVIKYIYRWNDKNGLQDLEKCRWYLNRLIEKVGKNQSV